jgi:subtilisin family serine protease
MSIYNSYLNTANSMKMNSDIVFVKAAGNNGCVISQSNCDPINAVLYSSNNFAKRSIIVGALNGNSLASYSNKAGDYSDRFVVEDGRGMKGIDGNYSTGTSFATPRVSGYVAIVAQKFPNLNAEKLSNIILQTSGYDSLACNPNCDKTIYGQGLPSLSRALAPVGRLK